MAGTANTHCRDAFLPICIIALIFLQFLPAGICRNGKAEFDVFGPGDPVLATVGEDTELWCHLFPNISAEDMELRWYRDQPSPAVHMYEKGKDVYGEQMAEYQGRTTFVSDRVTMGEAAVRIHNVTAFDNGTYHCQFKDGTHSNSAIMWLRVAGLGSEPTIQVTDEKDKGTQAECTSMGWYPEPEVEWKDFRGQTIPSVTNFSASNSTGLFAVASRVTIQDRAVEGLFCFISNPLLSEWKVARKHLHTPFSRRFAFIVWKVALPLVLSVLGLLIVGIICFFWKRQREKSKKQLEMREQREQEHRQQASRENGKLFYGWRESDVMYVSPCLDPETMSPKLTLSEDQNSVSRLHFEQDCSLNPRRFDQDPCILGKEQFSAGRYFWEVEVGNRKAWILGVCLETLSRKGRIPKSPQHGLWAVEFYKKRFQALSYPRIRLHPSEPLHRVGIFLDCDAGNISFYNMTDGSLFYTFSGLSFSGPLKPFLCLWTHDPTPLTICSVARMTQEDTGPSEASDFTQDSH
ncbi:butyrophilin-like protein 10 [Tupaia chinensis]|uniref:butyrophilin-like protein 10 n=1 Tax=Tupaia chinensis TaxID=246437 RepID=UPI000FFB7597|nr:butyrophilin-like protein 10 [Tupaia chinensis]